MSESETSAPWCGRSTARSPRASGAAAAARGAPAGRPAEAGRGSCCGDVLDHDRLHRGADGRDARGREPRPRLRQPAGATPRCKPGETVLDLGSGAGIDCFLAAREVGPAGRVIGVDMTPAMIERARANAAKARRHERRVPPRRDRAPAGGRRERGLIISNCVINLSPDKPQVFREALPRAEARRTDAGERPRARRGRSRPSCSRTSSSTWAASPARR